MIEKQREAEVARREFDRVVLKVLLRMPHRWDRASYMAFWRLSFSDDPWVALGARVVLLAIHSAFFAAYIVGMAVVP
jgi:hypothetical protein